MEVDRQNFRYGSASAVVVIDSDGTGFVKNVYSQAKNKGEGTGVMNLIINWAEAKDVVLFLHAQPYGPRPGLNQEALEVFYKKFGFERDPKYPSREVWMFRAPSRYLEMTIKEK